MKSAWQPGAEGHANRRSQLLQINRFRIHKITLFSHLSSKDIKVERESKLLSNSKLKRGILKGVGYKHQTSTDSSIIIIMCPKDVSRDERSSKSPDGKHMAYIHLQSVNIVLCLNNLSKKTTGKQKPSNKFRSLGGEGNTPKPLHQNEDL